MEYAEIYLDLLEREQYILFDQIEVRIEAIEKEIEDFEIYEDNHFLFEYYDFMSMPWYIKLFFCAGILMGSFIFGLILEFITRLS